MNPGLPPSLQACLAISPDRWPLALLALATCAGLIALGACLTRGNRFPGHATFAWFRVAACAWVLLATAEHLSASADCKIGWALNAWPAIIATSSLWAVFLWRYTQGRAEPLPRAVRLALRAAPLLMWGVALTNGWHGLLYRPGTGPIQDAPGALVRYLHGPLFWLAAAGVYAGMLAAAGSAALRARETRGPLRGVRAGLLVITLVPWVANLSYVFFGLKVLGADPTPFSFLLALGIVPVFIRQQGLFSIVPVARGALVDAMPDPVLVVDEAGRVVDANLAARRLGDDPPLGGAVRDWPKVGTRLAGPDAAASEHGQPVEADGRVYEIRGVPLRSHGERLGTLFHLRDVTERHRSERRLAQALAQRDAEIERGTALQARLMELALRDSLTGLHNRRAMEEAFARECARSGRTGHPVSVALIDFDRFKLVNDTHGHAVGDEVLVIFATRLSAACRASDGVFRLGGEEFALLLPGSSLDDACARVEAIIAGIAARAFVTSAGVLPLTASAGVAQWREHGDSMKAVLHAADGALYAAKAAGRNRVVRAPVPASSPAVSGA